MTLSNYIKLNLLLYNIKKKNVKENLKRDINIDIKTLLNIVIRYDNVNNIKKDYLFLKGYFNILGYWRIEKIISNFNNLNYNDEYLSYKKNILKKTNIGKMNNRVRIICKRVTQNIFLTLINNKGDVLKRLSLGYFLSIWSSKLNDRKKILHSLNYNLKLKYFKNKRKYQKSKSKIKNVIRASKSNRLLHLFCNRIIPILSSQPLNVIYIDIVFINLENNFENYLRVFFKRLGLINKSHLKKRLSYKIWKKYKNNKKAFKKIYNDFKNLLNFCLKTKIKSIIYMKLIRSLIKYYGIIKYYISGYDNKRHYKRLLNYNRTFFLNMLQLNNSYLYY